MFNWVIFSFFFAFLACSGEHIIGSIAAFFALDDVFRWGLISSSSFYHFVS